LSYTLTILDPPSKKVHNRTDATKHLDQTLGPFRHVLFDLDLSLTWHTT
jgi:hypothetical protein